MILKTKTEARRVLKENIFILAEQSTVKERVVKEAETYGILSGNISSLMAQPSKIDSADIRFVGVVLDSLYNSTRLDELNPAHYFTKNEIIEMKQYYNSINDDEPEFPLTFENVTEVGRGVYYTFIDSTLVARLYKHKKLFYNFDIQREASKMVRNDKIIVRPTIKQKNLKEIKNLILQGLLTDTTLAFNIPFNSLESDDDMLYDPKERALTLSDNVRLDILDGAHRCLGSMEAYEADKSVSTKFVLRISNHTTEEARQYQAQLAKATSISKSRAKELEVESHAATVVQILNSNSELRGKISSSDTVREKVGELVTFRMLSSAIEMQYDIKSKIEARRVAADLGEYFEYLVDYFVHTEEKEDSLLKAPRMFYGYVTLARRMKEENVPYIELENILNEIDFNKDNSIWRKGTAMQRNSISQKSIISYFENLKIKN